MKKIMLFLVTALAVVTLAGCPGTMSTTTGTQTAVQSAQAAATDSLYAIGVALQATPGILDSLYNAGKLSKADYNKTVPIYNQALTSFQLAVSALKTAKTAGLDPNTSTAYVVALNSFLLDKKNIDNLITAFGETPIGGGVK